jgi:tripartite-type tricarboxylate transporter receptor subunit TctC
MTSVRWCRCGNQLSHGERDVPTLGDFIPGFEGSVWRGVGAPKNTPVEIVDKLNKKINAGLADPKIKVG